MLSPALKTSPSVATLDEEARTGGAAANASDGLVGQQVHQHGRGARADAAADRKHEPRIDFRPGSPNHTHQSRPHFDLRTGLSSTAGYLLQNLPKDCLQGPDVLSRVVWRVTAGCNVADHTHQETPQIVPKTAPAVVCEGVERQFG